MIIFGLIFLLFGNFCYEVSDDTMDYPLKVEYGKVKFIPGQNSGFTIFYGQKLVEPKNRANVCTIF